LFLVTVSWVIWPESNVILRRSIATVNSGFGLVLIRVKL